MTTFEQAFAATEKNALGIETAAKALTKAAKQMERAAHEGNIPNLRKAVETLSTVEGTVRQEIANARVVWPFAADAEEDYLRASYEQELTSVAQAVGLQIRRADVALVASPSVIRIRPTDRALQINRRKVTGVRPSRVVELLRDEQLKKPTVSSERFLELLFKAYRLLTSRDDRGPVVALNDIYEALTLLPSAAADYDKLDFARDLYFLDRSRIRVTKAGVRFSLPASTGTKGGRGTFQFMSPDGEVVTYYGIQFVGD